MTISTVGYEGLDIEKFVTLLKRNGVRVLVDVRELPLSRKTGFSKNGLAARLAEDEIGYVHMVSLGCPKSIRNRYRDDGSWKRYTKAFLEYLETQNAAIEELAELAGKDSCALMCFEADYRMCHRSLVANAVCEFASVGVRHLTVKDLKTAKPELAPAQLAFA